MQTPPPPVEKNLVPWSQGLSRLSSVNYLIVSLAYNQGFMKTLLFAFVLLIALVGTAHAQERYWVSFADKPAVMVSEAFVSPLALKNRDMLGLPQLQDTDHPINPTYISQVLASGTHLRTHSRWLNAISVFATQESIAEVAKLPFVTSIQQVRSYPVAVSSAPIHEVMGEQTLSTALKQINGQFFMDNDLDAKGVDVGIIDAGFFRANADYMLKKHFADSRVKGTRDYVSPDKAQDKFFDNISKNSTHGTSVFKMVAGTSDKYRSGLATQANFYLARTDNDGTEYLIEEDYWISAMEWMDSLGVRLINTSLGYGTGHTAPDKDYTPDQMDGKTTKITKAAQIAATEKGIILITSAGNEGNDIGWGIISAPADAAAVISIGATNSSGLKMGYSSKGPHTLPYVKPNISCFSLSGTSFSAPVITGMMACLLQAKPELTSAQAMDILQKASHLSLSPNTFIGHGIPDCALAYQVTKGKIIEKSLKTINKKGASKTHVLKLKKLKGNKHMVVFHKSSPKNTESQNRVSIKGKKKVTIKQPKNVTHSTVVIGDSVFEIIW